MSDLAGESAIVLASGFLSSSANSYGEQFRLIAVLADGTVLTLDPTSVDVQVIHNAADPAAAEVDVYINGALALPDFAFRSATPFLGLPAHLPNEVAIAPAGSDSVEDAIFTESYALGETTLYLVANGVLNPDNFADNPEGNSTAFNLFPVLDVSQTSDEPDEVDVRVFYGATDAPAVDLGLEGIGKFLEEAAYTDFSGYFNLPEADFILELYVAGADDPLLLFDLPLESLELAGNSVFALASGFLDPAENENGEAFEIIAVLADGTVVALPLASPANDVTFSVDMTLQSFLGNFDVDAGDQLYVRGGFDDPGFSIQDANELSAVGDGIWETTLSVRGNPGDEFEYKFYILTGDDREIPNDGWEGNVGPGDNGNRVLTLEEGDTELETVFFNNQEPGNAGVQIIHNAADPAAAMVDIYVNDTRVLDDFGFREATPFLGLPSLVDIDITVAPPGSNSVEDGLATFTVNLDPGIAYSVIAQGVLSPGDFAENPDGEAFTLIVVLPDGTVVIPPVATSATDDFTDQPQVFTLDQNYPNPFNPTTQISYTLPQTENVTLRVFDMLGREVATLVNGEISAGVHTVSFDGSNLASGMYIYRLQAGEFTQTRKMMLIK